MQFAMRTELFAKLMTMPMSFYNKTKFGRMISRLTSDIAMPEQKAAISKLRDAMATYRRTEDLINLGAYVSGANPKVDAAVRVRQGMEDFLKQAPEARVPLQETMLRLTELASQV